MVATRKEFNILCGNIKFTTIGNFLHYFFYSSREDINCEILNINKMSPDLEIEGLLKREKTLFPTFVDMTFREVAHICSAMLSIVHVAVETKKYKGGPI